MTCLGRRGSPAREIGGPAREESDLSREEQPPAREPNDRARKLSHLSREERSPARETGGPAREESDLSREESHLARGPIFNPRPRTGSDPTRSGAFAARSRFQSTPPHGERHRYDSKDAAVLQVSIHAPARGATHTARLLAVAVLQFQSTPPHGERPPSSLKERRRREVSIHAPARGATPRPPAGGSIHRRFNPRPRTGSDTKTDKKSDAAKEFQSTPPHGERHQMGQAMNCGHRVSIHAPARGATWLPEHVEEPDHVSIHAPARGAT